MITMIKYECILYTYVVHYTAQNSSDSVPHYSVDNHHISHVTDKTSSVQAL